MSVTTFFIIMGICIVAYVIYDAVNKKNKREGIEAKIKNYPEFTPTEIYLQKNGLQGIAFDEERKKILFAFENAEVIYPFSKLISSEIIKDKTEVFKSSKTGAVVGGILAGGVGAIVGGSSGTTKTKIKSLELKLTFDDLREPIRGIQFYDAIDSKGDSESLYGNDLRIMERWHGIFTAIISRNNKSDS